MPMLTPALAITTSGTPCCAMHTCAAATMPSMSATSAGYTCQRPKARPFSSAQALISAPRLAKARIGQGESTKVEIDVTNTGKLAGDEVVQLYVHDETASVTRPVLELKHYKRVTLAPGAKTTVTFEIKPSDLWMWNLDMKRVVEPGAFKILVGPNSVDLKTATLTVS